MKVIDLLNKIANGEDLHLKYFKYFDRTEQKYDICMICETNIIYKLDIAIIELNDEIEIIEDTRKIEYLESKLIIEKDGINLKSEPSIKDIQNKLNEIIDYINKERK